MVPFYAKAIGIVAPLGLIATEAAPSLSEWAKLPIETLCVMGMGYVVIKVIPQMVKDQISSQEKKDEYHSTQLDKILAAHKEANTELSTAICGQMECQTNALTAAIKEVKGK